MLNILVVDDSPTMRRMIVTALRGLRASFREAGNGLEAIEQLALRPYDAMTLDLNMPYMHGIEVVQFVRASEVYHALPILVITTREEDSIRDQVMEAGADRWVQKPFTAERLLEEMHSMLDAAAADTSVS
jgi:two-component system chemotaxis response regulator CheY